MKKLQFTIAIVLLANVAFAQSTKTSTDIIVTPSLGVGKLKLGMSDKEAIKLLGGDITWRSYKQQLNEFKSMGDKFAIDSIAPFIIGFDSVAMYNGNCPASMPIFNMYFKNHKLNFITISSYVHNKKLAKKVRLNNGLKFGDDMEMCIEKLKGQPLSIGYGDYDGDYIYYKEGFEIIFDNNKFSCLAIFYKTPNFLEKIAANRDKLIADFNEIEKEGTSE